MALSAAEIQILTDRLAAYYAAEAKILQNQSYEMPDGRRLQRTDLRHVQAEINRIRAELAGEAPMPRVIGRARLGISRMR